MKNRTRAINDIGIGFAGSPGEYIRDIRIYDEIGIVRISVEMAEQEFVQCLSPLEAMAFAKALERCAAAALKSLVE